jgi:hypothetical protein
MVRGLQQSAVSSCGRQRQLGEGIEDRTDTRGSMRKFVAMQNDGRRDTCCTPASYPVVLSAPNGSAARGDWRGRWWEMAV